MAVARHCFDRFELLWVILPLTDEAGAGLAGDGAGRRIIRVFAMPLLGAGRGPPQDALVHARQLIDQHRVRGGAVVAIAPVAALSVITTSAEERFEGRGGLAASILTARRSGAVSDTKIREEAGAAAVGGGLASLTRGRCAVIMIVSRGEIAACSQSLCVLGGLVRMEGVVDCVCENDKR